MWIVEVALRRPYTFIVFALLVPIFGLLAILGTPLQPGMSKDIFPEIRIPVIAITFQYTGMSPDEMAGRITSVVEGGATTVITDIEHIESQTYPGRSVIKFFFQPGVNINLAMAQATAFAEGQLRSLPPGSVPPVILKYDASSVPILQLALSSNRQTEAQLFDYGNQIVRSQIGTVAGAAVPFPYGGAARQVQVDIRPDALRAHGLTASDVNAAIGEQNIIVPSGTQKIGDTEYSVRLNASPLELQDLNDLPIRAHGANGATTYIRDVAFTHDGHPPQTNIVRTDGRRAVLMTIQKIGSASTLTIVDEIKKRLPHIRELLPEDISIALAGDQSVFVRGAIKGVTVEAAIAATLTGLMVLLFLGSWRSTLIVTISIPLSIFASIVILHALGETLNLMTLGGLALAVGILVDDATVTIENINRYLERGQSVEESIFEGSRQILAPAFVSTLAICIVFVPMFLLSGVARYLFVPFAEAVVFAMLTSFVLSRTLVPTLCKYWLRPIAHETTQTAPSAWVKFQRGFEARFDTLRESYRLVLMRILVHRGAFIAVFSAVTFGSMLLVPFLGQNFFPEVDAGLIKLHVRAPAGLRIEETARLVDRVEAALREFIPRSEIASIVDNVGLTSSHINLIYSNSGTIGSSDADIMVSLNSGHSATRDYVRNLRLMLPEKFPGCTFSFLPADIISQILNFGSPAPIDIQIVGRSPGNRDIANQLSAALRRIPGLVDVRIQQQFNHPELRVNTDRTRALQLGITQRDIANDVLLTLSGSAQIAPTYWLNSVSGLQYPLVTQAPQYRMSSLQDLHNLPVTADGHAQVLGALASITRSFGPSVVSRYDTLPVINIFATTQDRDLGAISNDVQRHIAALEGKLPKGSRIALRGQVRTMQASYIGLGIGFVGAIVLVYLLIVVNFQSWLDSFVCIAGLPAAVAGIAWMLFITGTTWSVPALIGAVMCMGVATANSILVVSFARDRTNEGENPMQAAYEAGVVRLRPVLMTACAILVGMLPMSLGIGEGGEQNAPLGRAVIGGLLFATVATLVFVPAVFVAIRGRSRTSSETRSQSMADTGLFDRSNTGSKSASRESSVHSMEAARPDLLPSANMLRMMIAAVLIAAVLAIPLVLFRLDAAHNISTKLKAEAEAQSMLIVQTMRPKPPSEISNLVLPGNLQAQNEAPIYARTSGYLKRWLVDIGARVKEGQLLAVIESPELDSQLRQAEADLTAAQVKRGIAGITAERWRKLREVDSVSRQQVDEKLSVAAATDAQVGAARANVQRLRQLAGFERITAPFDGVITARNADIGQLVVAGANTGPELFRIADLRQLRIYVSVPQTYASAVIPGLSAQLEFPDRPKRSYTATLERTSNALEQSTRTMLAQLSVDNSSAELLPGAYAEVHFKLRERQTGEAYMLPANVLLSRDNGMQVAAVDGQGRVVMKAVDIGRDTGTEVEIISGVSADDLIVISPPDSLADGVRVRVAAPPRREGDKL